MGKPADHVSAFDRAVQSAIGDDRPLGNPADPARERYPELWRWLSTVYVGKDRLKQPATLTIRLGPGGVLASLTDRDLCITVEVSVPELADTLAQVEAQLTAGNPVIRSWGNKEPQLRKRRGG